MVGKISGMTKSFVVHRPCFPYTV